MKKCVAYIRVSTEEQVKEGFSIDGQRRSITHYAEKNGWRIDDYYIDEGLSGSSIEKRKALRRLLDDCRTNSIDNIIIIKVDRLSRNSKDSAWLLQQFENAGVKLISLKENIDLTSASGRAMFHIVSSFAEFERNKLIENVKTGMKQKALEGQYLGGQILGYQSIEGELKINDHEVMIVRLIFYLNAAGYLKKEIATFLNNLGFKSKKNRKFTDGAIVSILRNRNYIGEFNYKFEDKVISNHLPKLAIIEPKLFHIKQTVMKDQTNRIGKNSFLTNVINCPDCLSNMIPSNTTNKGVICRYYSCSKHKKGDGCTANSIRKEKAESVYKGILQKYISNLVDDQQFSMILNNTIRENKTFLRLLINLLDNKLETTVSMENRLFKLISTGQVSQSLLKPKYEEIIKQKNYIMRIINSLNKVDISSTRGLEKLSVRVLNYLSRTITDEAYISKGKPSQRDVKIILKSLNNIKEEHYSISFVLANPLNGLLHDVKEADYQVVPGL